MSLPKLAFVGPPHAATSWLISSLRRHGTFEALCDADAEREAARLQVRWTFNDLADMLRESEPAGVVLARPPRDRVRLIKQCLTGGASVLVTGAPCSASAAGRLSLFARLSGRCVLAAPAIRYSPAVMLARRLLDSGKLGAPISLSLRSTRRGLPRADFDDHGPVPADQVFEAVDVASHLIGPIRQVAAVPHADGVVVVAAESAAGVPVSLVLHASGPAESIGLELEIRSADGASLRIDRNCELACGNGSRVDAVHRPNLAASDPAVELGYDGLIGEFLRLLRPGTAAGLVGPVAPSAAATEAILASAARGRPVCVRLGESPRRPGTPEATASGA
ncbi:MAG: hypothetical protein DCC65_01880 [Planctomycetota bacterium]|nr:MAG: hypothetical protein DCC65_01880 [Planctomycetota bacterium]